MLIQRCQHKADRLCYTRSRQKSNGSFKLIEALAPGKEKLKSRWDDSCSDGLGGSVGYAVWDHMACCACSLLPPFPFLATELASHKHAQAYAQPAPSSQSASQPTGEETFDCLSDAFDGLRVFVQSDVWAKVKNKKKGKKAKKGETINQPNAEETLYFLKDVLDGLRDFVKKYVGGKS